MKVIFDNENEEYDFKTDIMHIRMGLEVLSKSRHDDIGIYNLDVLLKKAIKLEKMFLNKNFYEKNRLVRPVWYRGK